MRFKPLVRSAHRYKRMVRGLVTAMALLAAVAMEVSAAEVFAEAPRVQSDAGTLRGKLAQANGVALHEFLGIPYAAPPLGALRWKPPQPVAHWRDVRDAQKFGPRCMQLPLFSDMVFRSDGMSEDCLYLNVWTPASAGAKKWPVLVYFYGGGYQGGDGSEPRYDGASLASTGIVTVTLNYRLGAFGFMALPALAQESPRHVTGNYGLLDQNAALRWVKANIARFGGDPAQITIAGESSGAISVSAHMASPLSRGLIARGIGESGALIAPIAPQSLADAEQRGKTLMQQVHASDLPALRALSAAELLQATAAKDTPTFDADIDGYFLTETPAATFARGAQARIPLLLGANSQEGFYTQLLPQGEPTPANYRAAMERLFGEQAERALALYPGSSEDEVKRSATALASDIFIAHSTWRWMDLQRRTGRAPVYFYYFAQPRPAKVKPAPGDVPDAGAVHSGEIEYALGNLDGNPVYAWTPADHLASHTMQAYFAQFIKTGDPNAAGLPHWPAVGESDGGLLRQTIDAHTRTEVDRGAARQAFLQQYFTTHSAPF